MISYLRTSILKSDAQTVVNPVNTVGVMGKGLAAEFRKSHPGMFERYRELCANQLLEVGKLWLWKGETRWILSFPTKTHWRHPSKLSFIEAGLRKFVDCFEERGITEIAFPRLGCGNGGLEWDAVRPMMESYLKPLPIPVFVHDYEVDLGEPEHIEHPTRVFRTNSFGEFWKDITLLQAGGAIEFKTLTNKSSFWARVSDERLYISRGGDKEIAFEKEDLLELWTLLNRGVVTRGKLSGKMHDEAYYVMALLSRLPYIRAVEIEKFGNPAVKGLEMVKRSGVESEHVTE